MIDVTDRAPAAAGSPGVADGLFITAAFNCPLRALKCHRAKLCSTQTTFIVMDVTARAREDLQVSTLLLAVQQDHRLPESLMERWRQYI